MGIVVSETEAEAENVDFDEALEEDHEGSEPPPLLCPFISVEQVT